MYRRAKRKRMIYHPVKLPLKNRTVSVIPAGFSPQPGARPRHNRGKRDGAMNPDWKKTVSLVAIPLLFIVIALLAWQNSAQVFEPPLLLALLNTLFLGLFPLLIAFFAYRLFRLSGSYCILLLGCGLLVMGLGSISAGWLNGLPDGSNLTPTIHNTAFFFGGLLIISAVSLISAGPWRSRAGTGPLIPVLCYGCAAAFVAGLSLADVYGFVPVFFVQGIGPTAIRQVVLSNALTFFALSSVLFYLLYRKRREELFFWFSVSSAFVAIGLLAIFFQQSVGSPIGWTGRIAQYAGASLTLAAVITLRGPAPRSGSTLEGRMIQVFTGEAATQTLMSAVGAAVILFDRDTTILVANPEAVRRLGREQIGEVLGHSLREFVTPEIAGERMGHLQGLLRSHLPVDFEDEQAGRVYHTQLTPIYDADGGISTILAISNDVTARKAAEETLKKSEERLALSLTAAGQAPWDYDVLTDTVTASDRMLEIYGIAPGHSLRTMEDWHTMILNEDLPGISRHIDHPDPATGTFHTEFRIRRASDGAIRWISSEGTIIRDTGGRPVRRIGVLSDVTGRKEGEVALAKSRAKLAEIIESIQDDLYGIDRDWTITLASLTFASRFGKKPADLTGKNFWEALPKYRGTFIEEKFRAAMETGEIVRFEMSGPYTGLWFNTTVFPSAEGITVLATDITKRKEAEVALRGSLTEKETLIREVHHRVKNNLQVISGLLDMSRTRAKDQTTAEILTDLMLKIQTMAQIHTHLYEGSDFGRVNIREQIKKQEAALSLIYAGRDQSIHCGITGDDVFLPVDQAVPCALVINEILSNAFKHAFFGRQHGEIMVALAQQDNRVRITIRDNGIGMPPGLEPGHANPLGLKLVRALVQYQLNGTLVIKTQNGTEVMVEFPIPTKKEG